MLNRKVRGQSAILVTTAVLIAGAALPFTICSSRAQAPAQGAVLAAWEKIATVLQHPRCMNCHQVDTPLQGDQRRRHIPLVVRGADDHGVGAMRCGNCHNETNNPTSGTPGAPHWALGPLSMLWEGLSSAELCRQLKDPQRNGDRDGEALIEHMDSDALVLWGWNPGGARAPVSLSHADFVEQLKLWVAGGMTCPK